MKKSETKVHSVRFFLRRYLGVGLGADTGGGLIAEQHKLLDQPVGLLGDVQGVGQGRSILIQLECYLFA